MYTTATSIYNSSKHHQPQRKPPTHSCHSPARATTYLPSDYGFTYSGYSGVEKRGKTQSPGACMSKADSLRAYCRGSTGPGVPRPVCVLSHVRLFVTPWTEARQAPLSLGFSRQEYWHGLPFLPPGDHPEPGTEPAFPALVCAFFTIESPDLLCLKLFQL